MGVLVNLIPLPRDLGWYLLIDMGVAIALLGLMWWMSSLLLKGRNEKALTQQDNFAYGISVSGRLLGLAIVLVGGVVNSRTTNFLDSTLAMLEFGVLGIVLIKIGRYAHDKIILHRLDKEFHIRDRNAGIALVDAASSIATALVVQSVMVWAKGTDGNAVVAIISGFVVCQTISLTMTRLYERRFADSNRSGSLQSSLEDGQLAIAVQHSGHLLGTALVVTATGSLLEYNPVGYVSNLTSWLIVGLTLTILLSLLVALAKRIVLANVDLVQEIDQHNNVGVASVELALSMGIAFILKGLLG